MEVSKILPGDQSTFTAFPQEDMVLKLKAPVPNQHEISNDPDAGSSKLKKPKSSRLHTKASPLKKAKRYAPYESRSMITK